jgi:hypothetical protein
MKPEDVGALSALAAQAGAVHSDMEAARNAQDAEEARLLDAVVAGIGPALKALSSRIVAERSGDTVAADRDHFQAAEAIYHEARGLLVVDGVEATGAGTGTKHYEGDELYLLADGSWLECWRVRDTTIWQGHRDHEEGSRWRVMTSLEVAAEYEVDGIVGAIQAALERYVKGNATKRAAEMRTRTAKITALVSLLG